jgi:hypothetical protein
MLHLRAGMPCGISAFLDGNPHPSKIHLKTLTFSGILILLRRRGNPVFVGWILWCPYIRRVVLDTPHDRCGLCYCGLIYILPRLGLSCKRNILFRRYFAEKTVCPKSFVENRICLLFSGRE